MPFLNNANNIRYLKLKILIAPSFHMLQNRKEAFSRSGKVVFHMGRQGTFVPAGEKERIRELQILISNLKIRTHLLADTVSNFTPVTAYLPYERGKVIKELQFVQDNIDEKEMQEYRKNLKSLG